MPPLLTFVARISDGLPLVANTAPDVSSSSGVTQEHKNQAKDILRGLGGTATSAAKMSIDTSNHLIFHYLVRDTLCFLTLLRSESECPNDKVQRVPA